MNSNIFIHFPGDLKNENSVLEWVLNSDNRELDDAIEAVNMKMLNKLLQSSPFMAVFFCKFYCHSFFYLSPHRAQFENFIFQTMRIAKNVK